MDRAAERDAVRRVCVVVNPRAGFVPWKEPIVKTIRRFLSRNGFEWELRIIQGRGHGRELAAEAAAAGFDVVLAVGGDGTVNACASGLVNTSTCLAVVPTGSGNGMARGLGVPLTVRRALEVLCDGQIHRIDAGKVNDTYFFVTAGIGLDAEIGHEFVHRDLRGLLPYFAIGVKLFLRYEPQEVQLSFPDREITRKVLVVAAANMPQYGGSALIAPKARPDDGTLDVCVVREVKLLPALYYLPRLFLGTIDTVPYVEVIRTTELVIHRPKPGPYHCDGEPFEGGTELRIRIIPSCLSVLAPRNSPLGRRAAGAGPVESSGEAQ
jgi:diacylglycerol kinase (ATP)